MLLPGPHLHCVGPLVLWDFYNISCQVQVKTKKVLYERGAPDTVPYVKSVPGYCIKFLKGYMRA